MIIKNTTPEEVFNELNLKQQSMYLIKVKCSENNIEHKSVLFTGFKSGGYCEIYTNTYDYPIDMMKVYSIKIIKELK